MPTPERFMLGPRAARFIQDEMKARGMLTDTDNQFRNQKVFARANGAPYPEVRVTSLTQVAGRYPGKVLEYDANTDTYSDFTDCWIVEVNGGALAVQRYQATRKDEQNGRLVFVIDKGSGTGGGGSPGGVSTSVQVNDGAGGFAGYNDFLYVNTTHTLSARTTGGDTNGFVVAGALDIPAATGNPIIAFQAYAKGAFDGADVLVFNQRCVYAFSGAQHVGKCEWLARNSAGGTSLLMTMEGTQLGWFGSKSAQINLTGSKGGNAALASVIALLVAFGLATDSTT